MRHHKLAILLCLVSIGFQAHADNKEQILIHADSMQLDVNTGNSVYRGNVSFTQGKIEIHGDTITVSSKNGSINEIKIEGDPARYSDTSQNNNHVLAESNKMDYRVADNQLSMQGKARLEQGDRLVQSENILYDTKKQIVLAGHSSDSKDPSQRVNIILTPKKPAPPKP
jgi:lipopolysaccharide export system protein LptA